MLRYIFMKCVYMLKCVFAKDMYFDMRIDKKIWSY